MGWGPGTDTCRENNPAEKAEERVKDSGDKKEAKTSPHSKAVQDNCVQD